MERRNISKLLVLELSMKQTLEMCFGDIPCECIIIRYNYNSTFAFGLLCRLGYRSGYQPYYTNGYYNTGRQPYYTNGYYNRGLSSLSPLNYRSGALGYQAPLTGYRGTLGNQLPYANSYYGRTGLGYQAPYLGNYANALANRAYQPGYLGAYRGYQVPFAYPRYNTGYPTAFQVPYAAGTAFLPRTTYYQNYQSPAYQIPAYPATTYYQSYPLRLV